MGANLGLRPSRTALHNPMSACHTHFISTSNARRTIVKNNLTYYNNLSDTTRYHAPTTESEPSWACSNANYR